jgi:hypothetical protein
VDREHLAVRRKVDIMSARLWMDFELDGNLYITWDEHVPDQGGWLVYYRVLTTRGSWAFSSILVSKKR